jgi:RUN domain-containing protein 1
MCLLNISELDKIREMEEEHETLLSSLMALTTHFAQVQFRLHQVIEAPEKERDVLLKKLEDFADRGIPNYNENQNEIGAKNILTNIDSQKNHQQELIEQLKTQLDDLEKYAYESGEPILPQAVMVEKQKIIIDELKRKMNLNLNELDLPQLSPDELRTHVDVAIGEFVSPLKMKEQLIAQLETQINDLERFVKFLQVEKSEKKKMLKEQILKNHQNDCSDFDLHSQSCNCNSEDLVIPTTSSSLQSTVQKNQKFNGTHQTKNQKL